MRKLIIGVNDLETWCEQNGRMELLLEWHSTKNADLKPNKVIFGSSKKVWWLGKCGHEWEASISNRANGNTGCPFCSNKKVLIGFNDLKTQYPEVAEEWHPVKNGNFKSSDATYGSSQKVWWLGKCGHEWEAAIEHRTTRKDNCPFCSNKKLLKGFNDLQAKYPNIAKEWHPTKNGDLKPTDVLSGSHQNAWWKCAYGHEWDTKIVQRTARGSGCPFCSGNLVIKAENDLQTIFPEIAKEWHPTKNGNLKPSDVKSLSNKKVWWKCVKGHEWQAVINNRVGKKQGCPFCSGAGTSLPEQGIAFYLEQVCDIEQRAKLFGKEVDVYLPEYKIGIEYDGLFFHPSYKSDKETIKDRKLSENGIRVIRIKESDHNSIKENIIYYKEDKLDSNYEWAISQLCNLIYSFTANIRFKSLDIDVHRDILKIRERLNLYYKENSIATKYPDIAKEWNYEKNGELIPEIMSAGADTKVWWKCSKGHEWQTSPNSRTNSGSGCPFCSGKRVITGETDLQKLYPEIAKEWHPSKNGVLRPSEVTAFSNKKVWWLGKCGHEWDATVINRVYGNTGCPFCSGQRILLGFNDLQTLFPEIAKEWHPSKNGELKPSGVSTGTRKKVWWLCECGHEWRTSIVDRKNGHGCPTCAKRRMISSRIKNYLEDNRGLLAVHPELSDEWNYEKNAPLLPSDVTFASSQKVWWKCKKGHEWKCAVSNRTRGRGCPLCSHNRPRKVICVETGIIYLNISEAHKTTGISHIGSCCNGKLKTAGGFHWKFVD